MKREQAEQIARKHFAGADCTRELQRAVNAIMEAVAIEREECAELCETHRDVRKPDRTNDPYITTLQCAAAIRARGNE